MPYVWILPRGRSALGVLLFGGFARSGSRRWEKVHFSPSGPLTGKPQRSVARLGNAVFYPTMSSWQCMIEPHKELCINQDMRVRRRSPLIKVKWPTPCRNFGCVSDTHTVTGLLQYKYSGPRTRRWVRLFSWSDDRSIKRECLVPKVGARITWRTTIVSMNSISGVSRGGHWLMSYVPPPPSFGSPDIVYCLKIGDCIVYRYLLGSVGRGEITLHCLIVNYLLLISHLSDDQDSIERDFIVKFC